MRAVLFILTFSLGLSCLGKAKEVRDTRYCSVGPSKLYADTENTRVRNNDAAAASLKEMKYEMKQYALALKKKAKSEELKSIQEKIEKVKSKIDYDHETARGAMALYANCFNNNTFAKQMSEAQKYEEKAVKEVYSEYKGMIDRPYRAQQYLNEYRQEGFKPVPGLNSGSGRN